MPTQEKPDAIALLKAGHRKVEGLLASFEKTRDADRKQALVREICTELCVHVTIEEEILLSGLQGQGRRGRYERGLCRARPHPPQHRGPFILP